LQQKVIIRRRKAITDLYDCPLSALDHPQIPTTSMHSFSLAIYRLRLLLSQPISPDNIEPSAQEPFDVPVYLRKDNDNHQQAEDPAKQIYQI
jgi:hypothetical protein